MRCTQVPGGNKGATCRMGHTADGRFLACGNCKGHVYVYDALQGTLLTHLRPRRVRLCVLGFVHAHLLPCPLMRSTAHILLCGALAALELPEARACAAHSRQGVCAV